MAHLHSVLLCPQYNSAQRVSETIDFLKEKGTLLELDRFMLRDEDPVIRGRLANAQNQNGNIALNQIQTEVTQKWVERQRRQRGVPHSSPLADPA